MTVYHGAIFIGFFLAFSVGVIFGGKRGWEKGLARKNWLWWKVPTLKSTVK